MDEYLIISKGGTGEITEKKSRFIANIIPVENEGEAQAFIEQSRKKYWDARHNCYAYVIGRNYEIQRFSDDGEPGGTAGKPMLDVLVGKNIHNAVVVVTRYFGGTLLGTGGLVRAYSQAVKAGIDNAQIVKKRPGIKVTLETDYSGIGKIQYIMAQLQTASLKVEYTDIVRIDVIIDKEDYNTFNNKVIEVTNGKTLFENIQETEYIKEID